MAKWRPDDILEKIAISQKFLVDHVIKLAQSVDFLKDSRAEWSIASHHEDVNSPPADKFKGGGHIVVWYGAVSGVNQTVDASIDWKHRLIDVFGWTAKSQSGGLFLPGKASEKAIGKPHVYGSVKSRFRYSFYSGAGESNLNMPFDVASVGASSTHYGWIQLEDDRLGNVPEIAPANGRTYFWVESSDGKFKIGHNTVGLYMDVTMMIFASPQMQ